MESSTVDQSDEEEQQQHLEKENYDAVINSNNLVMGKTIDSAELKALSTIFELSKMQTTKKNKLMTDYFNLEEK